MVYVDIKSIDGDVVTAAYRPERKDAEPGTIIFDMKTQWFTGYEKSPDDEMGLGWYIAHAAVALKRMTSETPIRMSGMSAWY